MKPLLLSSLLLSFILLIYYKLGSRLRVLLTLWSLSISIIGRRRLLFLLDGCGYSSKFSCYGLFFGNSSILLSIMLIYSFDEFMYHPKSCFLSSVTFLCAAASQTLCHSSSENSRSCRAYSQHLNIYNHLTNLSSSLTNSSEACESLSRREWQHLQNGRSR